MRRSQASAGRGGGAQALPVGGRRRAERRARSPPFVVLTLVFFVVCPLFRNGPLALRPFPHRAAPAERALCETAQTLLQARRRASATACGKERRRTADASAGARGVKRDGGSELPLYFWRRVALNAPREDSAGTARASPASFAWVPPLAVDTAAGEGEAAQRGNKKKKGILGLGAHAAAFPPSFPSASAVRSAGVTRPLTLEGERRGTAATAGRSEERQGRRRRGGEEFALHAAIPFAKGIPQKRKEGDGGRDGRGLSGEDARRLRPNAPLFAGNNGGAGAQGAARGELRQKE